MNIIREKLLLVAVCFNMTPTSATQPYMEEEKKKTSPFEKVITNITSLTVRQVRPENKRNI